MSIKICIIGSTGTGKSALCNTICGDSNKEKYPESEEPTSKSFETTAINVTWWDKVGDPFILIDTPGLGDTKGRDSIHIADMSEKLKAELYITTFIIVFNGQCPRFDDHLKAMITLFSNMFSNQFLKNAILIFTRWSYDKKSIMKRKKTNESEEKKMEEFNKEFREKYHINFKIPCAFLDNTMNDKDILESSDDEEKESFFKELNKIRDFSEKMKSNPFPCKDIQTVLTEKDNLKNKLNEVEKEKEKVSEK